MQAANQEHNTGCNRRTPRRQWLRTTLRRSQQEAFASSAMTATSDNFFHAFAIFLNATMAQMGWVTGLPQLLGAITQIVSLKLGCLCQRKSIIVSGAFIQATGLLAMSVLALVAIEYAVWAFIGLCILHHGLLNLIQPQWRAWMGNIVPRRRRGAFFAARSRITMLSSLAVFLGGGLLLSYSDNHGYAGLGFSILFLIAAIGRYASAFLLAAMHDPVSHVEVEKTEKTLSRLLSTFTHQHFRQYCLFVAGMQAMVAISAPFFAVYMLNDLQFSYWQFVLASVASIALQFLSFRFWGRCCDSYGNRAVMVITCSIIPLQAVRR